LGQIFAFVNDVRAFNQKHEIYFQIANKTYRREHEATLAWIALPLNSAES
jgi:hypothetical protein